MTDFLLRRIGDVDYPVDSTDVTDQQLFSALDPGLDKLLAYFSAYINVELGGAAASVTAGSVWSVARTGTVLSGVQPVASTMWEDPRRSALRERELTFPILALYRTTSTIEEFTLQLVSETQTWGLDYILGPLDTADARRLLPARTAVKKLIAQAIRNRSHPEYESGALQFGAGKGGFNTIAITSAAEDLADFGEQNQGMEFRGASMVLVTTELDSDADDAYPPLEGASITIGVGGSEGIQPEVIRVRTEVPPQGTQEFP